MGQNPIDLGCTIYAGLLGTRQILKFLTIPWILINPRFVGNFLVIVEFLFRGSRLSHFVILLL